MKIENEFTVPATIDEAWALLTDIPAIAPCLPGAKLTGSEGDVHEGQITVKVGPVTTQYVGTAELTMKDDAAHRAEISAKGREKRGAGNAQADISAVLVSEGSGTKVVIDTDLRISGKVAQFGRGMMGDISEKLLGQFAECLEGKLTEAPATAPAPAPAPAPEPDGATREAAADTSPAAPDAATRTGESAPPAEEPAPSPNTATLRSGDTTDDDVAPLDLLDLAGGAVAKRVVPIVVGIAVLVVLYLVFR